MRMAILVNSNPTNFFSQPLRVAERGPSFTLSLCVDYGGS